MKLKKLLIGSAALLMTGLGTSLSGLVTSVQAQEPITLTWWQQSFTDNENAFFESVVERYNSEQSDVMIEFETVPGEAWNERLTAAQAAGTTPDIITRNYSNIPFAADLGEIIPLDEYVDPAIFEDLHENIEEFIMLGEEHYAYPILVEPSAVLYYRKDLFEAAGLDPETPPTTWDELLEMGTTLTEGNVVGLSAAGNAGELGWTHWGWQAMAGGSLINEDWSEATINSPEINELVTFWAELHNQGVLPAQGFETGYNDITPLADGQTAMQISGSWAIGQIRNEYPDLEENIGVAAVPTPDGDTSRPTATLGGWTLTIDGHSENPQEAADFISWFLAGDEEVLLEFFRDTTHFSKFPARVSVDEAIANDPAGAEDAWRTIIAEAIVPTAVPEEIFAWDISMAYATAVESVYLGGMSVEDALLYAEEEINTYIQNNDYAGTNPRVQ